jgi:hypothetical protein
MKKWGCLGFTAGSVIGLLVAGLIFLLTQSAPPPPIAGAPPGIPPDVTVFLSERSVSRMAAESLKQPAVVDFDANGQMQVVTRVNIGRFEPVVRVGVLLEMQGTEVVSQLDWVKLGFLTIPAAWLPPRAHDTAALAGQTITHQMPPDFRLVGLTTGPDGLSFRLKWVGQ